MKVCLVVHRMDHRTHESCLIHGQPHTCGGRVLSIVLTADISLESHCKRRARGEPSRAELPAVPDPLAAGLLSFFCTVANCEVIPATHLVTSQAFICQIRSQRPCDVNERGSPFTSQGKNGIKQLLPYSRKEPTATCRLQQGRRRVSSPSAEGFGAEDAHGRA